MCGLAPIEFRVQCATTLLTYTLESKLYLPQTLIVIITALAVEYCGKLSIPPLDMLHGLAERLSSCMRELYIYLLPYQSKTSLASVQDACLVCMLRITADCTEVPTQIINTVAELKQTSKRHIRKVCFSGH
jgi:AP-4 complex subunit epsilon-1